jgi:hypothetical protein
MADITTPLLLKIDGLAARGLTSYRAVSNRVANCYGSEGPNARRAVGPP